MQEFSTLIQEWKSRVTFKGDNKDDEFVWNWWLTLSAISIVNLLVYFWQLIRFLLSNSQVYAKDQRKYFYYDEKMVKKYRMFHMVLAFFFVFQCAIRSFFPEIYNQRIVFFDHWMNSVFIGRALATVGEVTWIAQLGAGLVWCHEELYHVKSVLKPGVKRDRLYFIYSFAIAAVVLCSIAECFCNYAMFTLNYLANVIETCLWTVAMGSLAPYSIYVFSQAYEFRHHPQVDVSSIIDFAFMSTIGCLGFCIQLCYDHIPLQFRLWSEDVQINKQYMGLSQGIYSSIFDMKKSQTWNDWKDDWLWMGLYFTFGVWYILIIQNGPRLKLRDPQKKSTKKAVKQD